MAFVCENCLRNIDCLDCFLYQENLLTITEEPKNNAYYSENMKEIIFDDYRGD